MAVIILQHISASSPHIVHLLHKVVTCQLYLYKAGGKGELWELGLLTVVERKERLFFLVKGWEVKLLVCRKDGGKYDLYFGKGIRKKLRLLLWSRGTEYAWQKPCVSEVLVEAFVSMRAYVCCWLISVVAAEGWGGCKTNSLDIWHN